MVKTQVVVDYCDQLLEADRFQDYCPNGLQVEGREEVARLVTGVTASQALIDAACEQRADLLLVHHGYFWKGEDPMSPGSSGGVSARCWQPISVCWPTICRWMRIRSWAITRNWRQRLGLLEEGRFGDGHGAGSGLFRDAAGIRCRQRELAAQFWRCWAASRWWSGTGRLLSSRIGWCTGAAQCYLEAAARRGLDAFISGEISEPSVHIAREYGIHYFAAGHHATERYGVQALGAHLAERFGIRTYFYRYR